MTPVIDKLMVMRVNHVLWLDNCQCLSDPGGIMSSVLRLEQATQKAVFARVHRVVLENTVFVECSARGGLRPIRAAVQFTAEETV